METEHRAFAVIPWTEVGKSLSPVTWLAVHKSLERSSSVVITATPVVNLDHMSRISPVFLVILARSPPLACVTSEITIESEQN